MIAFGSSYYKFIYHVWWLSLTSLFLFNERQGVDLERSRGVEELGGLKGGKTITRIYCIRKKSIFNKNMHQMYLKEHITKFSIFSVRLTTLPMNCKRPIYCWTYLPNFEH